MGNLKKLASIVCFVLATIQILARDSSPLPRYTSILLLVLGSYLWQSHENPSVGPFTWKSFVEGFRPLPACKKAFIQMWIGIALIFSGMLFLYLYAQTERWWIALLFVTGPTVIYGLFLYTRYSYCLKKYQDDRTIY